jgi:hypothetical protein
MTMDKMNYERQLHKQITGKWQILFSYCPEALQSEAMRAQQFFFHEGHFVTGLKNNFLTTS